VKKRYAITLEEDVHQALRIRAARDRISVGSIIARLVDYESATQAQTQMAAPPDPNAKLKKDVERVLKEMPTTAGPQTGGLITKEDWPLPDIRSFNTRPFTPVPKK